MNDIFNKMIQKNCNYFSFFFHQLLCNIFIFFVFYFVSIAVIAGKEIDALESKKKSDDDKNVDVSIYNQPKLCNINNIIISKNGTVFYLCNNNILMFFKENIIIPSFFLQLIEMFPLEKKYLFFKKLIPFDVSRVKKNYSYLFNFFYKLEHLDSFLMYDDKNITFITEHVHSVDIVEVFRFCGFPSVEVVEHVKTWINLEKGYTLDWLWKNLSLNFKEQGVPNKHVFFSLIAEMEKKIRLSSQSLTYLAELKKCWIQGTKRPVNRNKGDWCMVERKLNSFFSFLSSKNIMITKLLFNQMKYFDFEKMISFCDKCKCFYENSQEKLSISSFFLKSRSKAETLLKYNNEDIKFIATHLFYKNILAIYRSCEFPPATMVREVDTWVNIKEGITPKWLWNNLSLNFKGWQIPKKEIFFYSVTHVERDINFIKYYQIIEYGLKREKRNNNQKCSYAYTEKHIDKAHELLMLLARKTIDNALSFVNIVLELDTDQISDFCDKIIYFYSTAKETRSIVPIFLGSMEKVYLFLENGYDDIEFIAQHSAYPFIVMVYFGVSFPVASCVKKADTWKHLIGGEDTSLIVLWQSLATLFANCGVPTKEEFFLYYSELSYNNYNIYEKKQKEELMVQKIKLKNDDILLLPSLNTDILKKYKNKINKGKQWNNFCSKESKEKIGELLALLIKKRIENIGLFIELLFNLILELDDNTIADFCDKMICFYSNTELKKSLVPNFFNSMKKVNLFLTNTHEEIKFIARHPCYSEIYEIYFGICFPSASCVKKFDTWENIVENITLVSLWKLLAKMFPGSGMPKRGTFLFDLFTLSHKQHRICTKNQGSELMLQEKEPNFNHMLLSLSLNIGMLNDVQRKNKISNDQEEQWSDTWDEKIINKIDELFLFLENKNIENIPSFMDVILKLRHNNIIIFCDKMRFFYSQAAEKRSIVLIFLNSIKKVRFFLHQNTEKNIAYIAQHPCYSYISEIYRGVDFPDGFDVQGVDSWQEAVQDITLMFLWKLLEKGFTGYGLPRKEMFFFFFSCCDAFYEKN